MRVRVGLLLALLVIDLLALGVRWSAAPHAAGVLDVARMAPEQGHAFTAPLKARPSSFTQVPNDGNGVSALRLYEVDGERRVELGPAHAPPDRVREVGGGLFDHWGEVLFSTSDGSDPRTNGRRYEWESPTVIHARLGLALLFSTSAALLWVLSGWFAIVPRARAWVFAALVFALTAAWNLEAHHLYPGWINVDWDTASYLGRTAERTAGYPLILETLTALAGDLRWLLAVQLNSQLAAFALLALAVDRLLRTRVAGLAIFVVLATSPRLMAFPFSVLTESFFVVGLCVLMALLCEVARWHGTDAATLLDRAQSESTARVSTAASLVVLACCGITLAATELVRPAAFGLAGMALLPVLWARGHRWRTLAATALPYVLVIIAAAWANERRFGFMATSSMGPVSLLGHVAWNIRAETCPELPELAGRIEERLKPVLARRPAELSWPKQHFFWTSDEYNELLWANVMPETHAWVEQHAQADQNQAVELLRIRSALAKGALIGDPMRYARHASAHVWGFWQSVVRPAPLGPALKGRVPRGVGSVANLWPEVRERRFSWLGPAPDVGASNTPFDRLTWMEWWRTPLDGNPSMLWKMALAATLAGLVMAPFSRRLTPAGRLLSLAGVGFQGSAVLVASATAVIARYVDAVEPLTVVACAAAIVALGETFERLRRMRAPRSHPPSRAS